ncbi:MAG: hypothetical protein H6672_13710 [Anaerolineaceae bacterium]|nr:hypothetical protein [Anaerolineaceae bacterium]
MENLFGWSDWRMTTIGEASITPHDDRLALAVNPTPAGVYSDSQITDYQTRQDFRWSPPARLTVTVYTDRPAADIRGTAGFGFWNHPFEPGKRGVHLPQAVWFFFSSPPSDMRLAVGVPGPGWKAATFDARRLAFWALLPTAPVGVFLMRIPALYRRLWSVGQRALGVSEGLLDSRLLAEPHTYTLDWLAERAIFQVDGQVVYKAPTTPRGPLGFIAWIDNQYAIVTPQGRFGFGLLPLADSQALILSEVHIETIR